jgi:ABC-type nitrate/sulfonate/bicarbonate transport system substrate-binding protein
MGNRDHRTPRRALSRREALAGSGALLAAALLPRSALASVQSLAAGLLSSASGGVAAKVSAGSAIPASTVHLGIMPFGDHSILSIGIHEKYFDDVGIKIEPAPMGEVVQVSDAVPRLSTGQLDITTWYTALKVGALAQTPNLTMIGFHDVYIGTYVLAAPWTKAKKVTEFLAEGKTFPEAMAATATQMTGKNVAFANDGTHRDFFNTVFQIGGLSVDSVQFQAIPDNQQVQLANSKRLDFASPSGAAQTVELMNQGWYSIVGTEELVKNLPKGDLRGVATIGNTGPGSSLDYVEKNYETVLRYMSVQFRIIDAIKSDPDRTLAIDAPFLQAAAGTSTTGPDLKVIMSTLDPLFSFEEQKQFWLDESSPWYYKSVLAPQIAAAKAGGLIPPDSNFTPDDVTIGAGIYKDLVELKRLCEELMPKASQSSDAAKNAAAQYKNRNYLDAYRMLKAAA